MKQRRKNNRNLCADLLTLRWTDKKGQSRTDVAILDDISEMGACIGLEHSIPPETKVSLHYLKGKYEGKIKYCRYFELGYFLGIAFDEGYRWSKADFVPAYLLEVPPTDETTHEGPARPRGRSRQSRGSKNDRVM